MSSDQMTIYLLSVGFTPAQIKEIRTAYKTFRSPLEILIDDHLERETRRCRSVDVSLLNK